MMKRSFIWTASILICISLLTETAYRLLSMESNEVAVSKNCVVLVFGWPTKEDGTLHPMQRFRVEAGVATYKQQQCRQIIFSGGAAQNKHIEGQTMAEYARTLGVQKSAIAVEPNAHTTWENLGCSAAYLETAERVFLVSDSLHAHRAKRYACRQNPSLCAKSKQPEQILLPHSLGGRCSVPCKNLLIGGEILSSIGSQRTTPHPARQQHLILIIIFRPRSLISFTELNVRKLM